MLYTASFDLVSTEHRQRSPSPSLPHQLVPDLADCFDVIAVSSATSPSFQFSLSSTVATARSFTARVAVELVADDAPATQRPHRHVHCTHRIPSSP